MKILNLNILIVGVLLIIVVRGNSQVVSVNTEDSVKLLYMNEKSFSINFHTQGLGIGYRYGKHLTGYKKLMYESELVIMKHPKEIKSLYPIDENSKSYFYGKLNSFFTLRGGVGVQKVINSKPYWGGVELRYFYYGGLSMGITKPVYLYIWNYRSSANEVVITTERYNPAKHDIENIYGRAPFTDGLGEIKFWPGLYGKFGYNFEFGQEDTKIRCLEVGLNVDAYLKPIPIMAFNKNNYFFLTAYLSYSFGKRYNKL